MALPHDIRMNVPQYNPEVFKQFERHGRDHKYPRMMTHEDQGKLVPYKHPNGKPVVVQNEHEEHAFLAKINGDEPTQPEAVSVGVEEAVKRGPGRPRKLED